MTQVRFSSMFQSFNFLTVPFRSSLQLGFDLISYLNEPCSVLIPLSLSHFGPSNASLIFNREISSHFLNQYASLVEHMNLLR